MNEQSAQRSDTKLILVAALLVLGVSVAAFTREQTPAWKAQQEKVREWVAAKLGQERAAALPRGMQQIYIEPLGRVDRCVTCHLTIEWGPELREAPHPARSHPDLPIFATHPLERFGCTLCHGGQGAATEKAAAHGAVEFWEEPLLDRAHAERMGVDRAELMEMRCNVCHRNQHEVEGMPFLNDAKAQVHKKRCVRCHTINGVGASKGPDLSEEGDKHPSHYHFPAEWRRGRTAFFWHVEHFREPFAVVPDTLMPSYTWQDRQPEALALLVLSWRAQDLPASWTPVPKPAPPLPDPRKRRNKGDK